MISMRFTENFAGVTIRGDYDDLYNLVEAFYDIKLGVSQAAKKHGCAESEIRLSGYEYPNDIEW